MAYAKGKTVKKATRKARQHSAQEQRARREGSKVHTQPCKSK